MEIQPSNRLPNILWICSDQQRFDTIGAINNPHIHTPNLDRLCKEGVAFTRAYCQSPVCTPSRASFLSGLYPSSIHVNRNGNEAFPDNVKLLSKMLADTGYDCGLAGKLHISSAWNGTEQRTDDGYRVFHYSHSPSQLIGKGNQYTDWLNEQGIPLDTVFTKSAKGEYKSYLPDVSPEHHQTTWCADRAIDFLLEERSGPWMMSVNFYDPHVPFDAPRTYMEKYLHKNLQPYFKESDLDLQEKLKPAFHQAKKFHRPDQETIEEMASYYGMIELIDENVGRIVKALEDSGQRENTLIIYMSDHGEMLGDHGLTHKGCRFYEGAVRVPLVFSWKGRFVENEVCNELVELTDIAPTLAQIAEIRMERTHGKSLLPLLKGEKPAAPHRTFVRCEYYDALNMQAPFHMDEHVPTFATMYRNDRYKLVVYHTLSRGELYDLQEDPHEFENLWDDPGSLSLKAELLKQSFDQSIIIADQGSKQIGRY